MNGRWTRYAGFYALALVALVIAANNGRLPVARLAHQIPWGDKVGHFLLMGTLAFTINVAVGPQRRAAITANVILALVMIAEECSQMWLRYRHFEAGDLAADLAGILVFAIAARCFVNRRGDRRPLCL